jgi:hypothetical protein
MVALETEGVECHTNTKKNKKRNNNFEDNLFEDIPSVRNGNVCCVTNWGSVYLQHGYIEGQRLRLETFAVIWQLVHYFSPFSFKSFSSFTPLPFGRTFPPLVGFLAFLWQFPLWLVIHSKCLIEHTPCQWQAAKQPFGTYQTWVLIRRKLPDLRHMEGVTQELKRSNFHKRAAFRKRWKLNRDACCKNSIGRKGGGERGKTEHPTP